MRARCTSSQLPPKVEYSLTERGKFLIFILDGMREWGVPNQQSFCKIK